MTTDGMTLTGESDSYGAAEQWIHAVENLLPALHELLTDAPDFALQATRLHTIDHGIGCAPHGFSDLVDLFAELSVKLRLHNHVAPAYKAAILKMEQILAVHDGRPDNVVILDFGNGDTLSVLASQIITGEAEDSERS